MTHSVLEMLECEGVGFGASDLTICGSTLEFRIPIRRASGRVTVYGITAQVDGEVVQAREAALGHLPTFCPERHINDDGSFCLGWKEADDLAVCDERSAHAWWARLVSFLVLQERAMRRRTWPNSRGWPHGAAAKHQRRAEAAAAKLGGPFLRDLVDGRLRVVRKRAGEGGRCLWVTCDGRRAFAV